MILLLFAWMGLAPPPAMGSHGDTHTPIGTVITFDSATVKFTWTLKSTSALFGDSRAVYTNKVYDTVTLLSSVDVTSNLETAFIGPKDSYTFVKHIRNLGNAYDTYVVRGDSQNNFVTGLFLDASDGDSVIDAPDPPAGTVVVKDIRETVVLIRVQAPPTATDGRSDTLQLSATSNAAVSPSAETVTLIVTLDSQPPTSPTLRTPANGLETTSVRPRFTWDTSVDTLAGLGYYRFEIDTSGLFTNPLVTDTRTDTAFTPTDTLISNRYYWRVRAIDTVGNVSKSNPDSFLLVIDTGVTISLVNPPNGHETNAATVRFQWSSPDAETYTWQLSKSAAFTTITDSVVDTKTTSLIRTLSQEDTYYWRVIARDTPGNMDTAAGRILILDTHVDQVILSGPANGHDTSNAKPLVVWNALSDSVGIDSYVVEVSKTLAFTSLVFADTVSVARQSDTITGLYNDTYYWRVRAIDRLRNIGPNSDTRGFLVDTAVAEVTLVLPADGHETTNARPAVSWTALTDSVGIDSYVVEVSKSPAFVTTVFVDTVDMALTSDTLAGLYNDTYYWHVCAIDNRGNICSISTARGFLLDTAAGQVILSLPADGHETTNSRPLVRWAALADSVGIDSYIVEASKSAVFATTLFADTVDGALTTDTITGLYNDTYYWRVRAIDNRGNTGAVSATRGFIVDTAAEKVVLVSPASGSSTTDSTPTLTWTAVTDSVGIDSYAVEVSASATFGSVAFADTVGGLKTSDTTSILQSGTYYWRVRAIDHRVNVGANSDSFVLIIDTAVTVTLVTPANGHETTNTLVLFVWSSPDAETYTWQLSKSTAFTTVLDSVVDTKSTQVQRTLPDQDTFYWRVIGKDTAGNMDTTTHRIVILDTHVDQVTLASPVNGHETSNAKPVVAWNALADSVGIDSYVVESSKSLAFTSLVFADTVSGTRRNDTITGLYNDTYYWRVRAIDRLGSIGPYSDTRGFLVDTAAGKVILAAPPTGTFTNDSRLALSWAAVADSVGIDSYVVEVSVRPAFDTISFVDTVDGSRTSDSPSALADSTYYWRVRAVDNEGNVGPNSDSFTFVLQTRATVTLVSPAAGQETKELTVRFVWSSLTSETYTWQLSKSPAFIAIAAAVADTTGTNVIQSIPDQDTFYWRVIGKDRLGNTDTTSARALVLDTSVDTVIATAPATGHETSNVKVVVSWSVPADSVGIDSFVVEASKSAVFVTAMFADTVDAVRTSDTITGLYNDTYYWRVRAIDDLGNAGAYSIARGFVIDTAVSQVTLVAPASGHETANAKPVVSWTAITVDSVGIDSYVVEVSKSQLFTLLVFADTVSASRTSDTLSGLYNDTYYWRVRAIDRVGNVGANSDSRSYLLDTQSPTVMLVSPATGVATNDSTPTLTWQTAGVLGILSNRLTVSRSSTFADSVYDTVLAGSRTSDTTKALSEATYYWRVTATNTVGSTVAAPAFTFLVDVTPPTAPAPISPKYGHETSNVKPTFSWTTSIDTLSGLYAYRLELSTDSLFTTLYRTDTYLVGGVGFAAATLETTSSAGELAVDTYYWRVIAIDNAGNTVGSIPPPFQIILINPSGSITFDRTEYKGLLGIATIKLTDPLANLSTLLIDQAEVSIYSDADLVGFTMFLVETDVNTNVFTGTIQFTTGLSNSAMRKIRVNPGSGVSAKRVQTSGLTVTGSARWLTELGTTPTTDVTKTRSWPNPWNPTSGEPLVIQNLPADPSMTIEIYTVDMKKVRSLYNGNGITASSFGNSAQWDGKNDAGQYVSSGVYLYLVRSQFGTTVKKITLVK